MTFDNYQSLNPSFSTGNFILNSAGGAVYFTWSSTTPVTIGDDQMMELVFTGITGSSSLTWNTSVEGFCEFSDLNGNIIFDNYTNGNVIVYQPPQITSNPLNKTAPVNTSTSFSVSAAGTGLGYTWQESTDNGNNWNSLSNGSPYSGVNTTTLTINPVTQSMNENQYRCRVSGTCTPFVYSEAAILNVVPPIITTSAGSVTNSCTSNISVPIIASNCNNVGPYRWC
ncbi:MAG: immunoglobulin domain-containing protein [Bacteroidales bacterium]